jgi:hypothetical protein
MGRKYSKQIPPRIASLLSDELVKADRWSNDFLLSIQRGFERYGSLTAGQFGVLEDLEARFITNRDSYVEQQAAIQKKREGNTQKWSEEYFGKKPQEDAVLIAKQHLAARKKGGPAYYGDLPQKIINGELPMKRTFDKFVGNKYAQGMLDNWYRDPKFPVDTPVKPNARSTHDFGWGIVVECNPEFPYGHAKGAKLVRILSMQESKLIICEERDLKLYRNMAK